MAGQGFVSLYQKIFAEPEQSFFHYRHKWIKQSHPQLTDGKENIVSQWGRISPKKSCCL